ncbi:M48 family metalloprotease [Nakamurella sp. YIM 132087]|uniref:M48 family metalloprotease n=1 Tax=Nakamurella alba TaxID=2665158 RepID=A0A7K1FQN5_9ACTN|nr:M48 family metallopeptidase [Nakamurella alba]MTD16465.1 M48 family metalloprotease [Nakamurella alba]
MAAKQVKKTRRTFPGISSRAWEHPADRAALVTLRSLSGVDTVLRKLAGLLRERQYRLLYLASAIRVDRRQFSEIDDLYLGALHVLDSPRRPELYLRQDPVPQAMTLGIDEPFIVLSTGMVDLMDADELRFVLGHEIGHALSGHGVYRTVLTVLMQLADSFGALPAGRLGLQSMIAALNEWSRKSELSADRAGLLASQDEVVALRVMMKLAGGPELAKMDTDAFLEQAAEYESTGDLRDGVLKLINLLPQTHPFSVPRAAALRAWVASGEYGTILGGDYPKREDDGSARIGEQFTAAAKSYKERFEASTDPLFTTLRSVGQDLGGAAGAAGRGFADMVSGLFGRGEQAGSGSGGSADGGETPDPGKN